MNIFEKIGATVLAAIVFCLLIIPSYILYGWVLVKLWAWFVIPVFAEAPVLTVGPAVGLSFILHYVFRTAEAKDILRDKDNKELGLQILLGFGKPLLGLLFGYIIHIIIA